MYVCVRAAYYVTCPIVLMCEKQGDFYYARQREGVKSSSHSCCLLCALHERKYKKAAANCTSANCGTVAISEQLQRAAVQNSIFLTLSSDSRHLSRDAGCMRWKCTSVVAPSILSDRERALLVVIGYFSIWSCMHACFVRKGWEHWHNFFNSKA